MKRILPYCTFIILAIVSCQESGIDETMKKAEANRKELEAVLKHYQNEPLKEKAARFLIENMGAHFAHTGKAVDNYNRYMDSVFRHCDGDRVFWIMKYDTILKRNGIGLEISQDQRLYDAQDITADFLIEHIDSTFAVWQQKWNKQYSFEIFCRYVLPYCIGNEKTSRWRRTSLALRSDEIPQYRKGYDPRFRDITGPLFRPALSL